MNPRTAACTALLFVAVLSGGGGKEQTGDKPAAGKSLSSKAYKGHENDRDIINLVHAYPFLVGTRLDDCQTCHRGGEVKTGKRAESLSPCSYCHLLPFPAPRIKSGSPGSYEDTLNPYGLAYKKAGRSREALLAIGGSDSDRDTFSNKEEIEDNRFPGCAKSKPGQPHIPSKVFPFEKIQSLAKHTQFLLLNSHKQQYDSYVQYGGIPVSDLLAEAKVDLSGATGVTVISADGFMMDLTLEQIARPYPQGIYCENLDPGGFPDPRQGVVHYPPPDKMPKGLVNGGPIPGTPRVMIACTRNGAPLACAALVPKKGTMMGEGPFRLVVPQKNPGPPDRGSNFSPSGFSDGFDYDDAKDHNAGLCARGIVAIRVNPMPAGFEEYDWKNSGWALIRGKKLVLFGKGVPDK